jgi:hypothetical protein
MPTTVAGTVVSVLSVENENHLDGWVFTNEAGSIDEALFKIIDSSVVVETTPASIYVPPGDKYITVTATHAGRGITYQSGLTIPIGDRGVHLPSHEGSVNYPTNMIAGILSDVFVFRFAILPNDALGLNNNLLGVEGDKYGMVALDESGSLIFNGDANTLTPIVLTTPAPLNVNKWSDVAITGYNDGASKVKIEIDLITVYDDVAPVWSFSTDLVNPWRYSGTAVDTFSIFEDALETVLVDIINVPTDVYGDSGIDIDHISGPVTTSVDTFSIWGDVGETELLGTFEVVIGQAVDHIAYSTTLEHSVYISNVGASNLGVELIRDDMSGSAGGMNLSGTATLMNFVAKDY